MYVEHGLDFIPLVLLFQTKQIVYSLHVYIYLYVVINLPTVSIPSKVFLCLQSDYIYI